MREIESGILTVAGGGGWLYDGEPWTAPAPFYAVLGDPITHSLSPRIQNAALQDRQLVNEYRAIQINTGQLALLKEKSWSPQLAGFNVTSPLKEEVARLCQGRTDVARQLGAVNTVKVEDGKWLGHNTDSGGITAVLAQAWTATQLPTKAIVLGAGGSARAAIRALDEWGVQSIEVRNRSAAGRDRIAQWLAGDCWQPASAEIQVAELLPREQQAAPSEPTVWVVCLAGCVETLPYLPDTVGDAPCYLLDLRYGDQLPATSLAPLGCDASDGKPVLLMQGGLSFAWWFGPPLPWRAMMNALNDC